MKATHRWHFVIFFSPFVCLITSNCPQTDIKFSSFLLSHPDLFFFWAEEMNGSTFPVSSSEQPAYGCSVSDCRWMSTAAAWHRYARWTNRKIVLILFLHEHVISSVHPHEATLNRYCPPHNQVCTHLIKLASFIIRHLTGTLQYNNTHLLHNSCVLSLSLTSPSNYALKSTNARAARRLVHIVTKNHISSQAHLGCLVPPHNSTVEAWWGFFWC